MKRRMLSLLLCVVLCLALLPTAARADLANINVTISLNPTTLDLTASWPAVSGAKNYEIRLMRDRGAGSFNQIGMVTVLDASSARTVKYSAVDFAYPNLDGVDRWKVDVVAVNSVNESIARGSSDVFSVNLPKLSAPVVTLDNKGIARWSEVPEADMYYVELYGRSGSSGSGSRILSFHDDSLGWDLSHHMSHGYSYRVSVCALDESYHHEVSDTVYSDWAVYYPMGPGETPAFSMQPKNGACTSDTAYKYFWATSFTPSDIAIETYVPSTHSWARGSSLKGLNSANISYSETIVNEKGESKHRIFATYGGKTYYSNVFTVQWYVSGTSSASNFTKDPKGGVCHVSDEFEFSWGLNSKPVQTNLFVYDASTNDWTNVISIDESNTYRLSYYRVANYVDSNNVARLRIGANYWGTWVYSRDFYVVWTTSAPSPFYDYYIDRVQITEANKADVLGDGTVKFYPKGEYDPNCNVLELTDYILYTNSGLGYHKYNKEGDIAAMYLGEDTIVILHGENYISGDEAYEGIVTGEDCKLEFKGDGFLNVDVGTENVAMVAPGGTITVSQQAEVEFYGSNGLEMPYAGGNVTVKDDAKFYCFGYQRNNGYDGGGFIGKGITVQNHGVFTAVSQYNGEAITTWVEEYPSSVYDIRILKKGEYTEAYWSWDHQAHQPYLIQNGLNTTGGVFEGDCRYINITARTTDCGGNPNACALSQFKDVPGYSNWAHKGIEYCVSKGLMSGTSATTFSPKTSMSRAMLVTVLYRMAGQPGAGQSKFSDVPANQWYSAAVSWAADHNIVSGVGGGKFDPNGNVTREQIATILFRYASFKGYNTSNRNNLAGFADAGKVGSWFVDGMKWAVAEGLISGTAQNGKTYLSPQGAATREQVAAILMRFCENVAK